MKMKTAIFILLSSIAFSFSQAVIAHDSKPSGVVAETKVMAPPDFAFEMFRSMRKDNPDGCKILSASPDEIVVEEIFDGLPVIGETVCTYKEQYIQDKKIGFHMLSSDKLKAFEGEWTFEPLDAGQHTLVKLRSFIDPGIKIPFAKQLTHLASSNEVKKQVADFKSYVESKLNKLGVSKRTSL